MVVIVGNDAGWGVERELQSSASSDGSTVACELRRTRSDIVIPAERECARRRSPFTEWNILGRKK